METNFREVVQNWLDGNFDEATKAQIIALQENDLTALAYYYKGENNNLYERIASNLIIGNTTDDDVICRSIFFITAAHDKIKPFFRITVVPEHSQILQCGLVELITGNDSRISTVYETSAPVGSLFMYGCCVETASEINIASGMFQKQ